MEILIVRIAHHSWGIDGHLYINRKLICDTVENPNSRKPQGEYEVDIGHYPFRHGDGALGCKQGEIIVGKRLMSGVVTASQATYDRLYERLKKAFQRGNSVRLTIRG